MPPIARFTLLARAASTPRSSHSVSVSKDGLIVLYSGELVPRVPVDAREPDGAAQSDDAPRGSVHIFDPTVQRSVTLEPTQTSDTPEPRVGASAVFAPDGALYLWGGRGGPAMAPLPRAQAGIWRGTVTSTATGDSSSIQWARVPAQNEDDAPEPRSYHVSVVHDNKIYIHAGCPAAGRLGTLHAFDLRTRTWAQLAPAPGPARGGTALAPTTLRDGRTVFVRFGGFAGHELPAPSDSAGGTIDIYDPRADSWHTLTPAPDAVHGVPGARSVHGLVGGSGGRALLWYGEREASALGHAGAGAFWGDVWVLESGIGGGAGEGEGEGEGRGWAWRRAEVRAADEGVGVPEARGWFAGAAWEAEEESGAMRAVMHGGLVGSNERRGDLWLLEVV
ncbi:galactose oxidase [Dentipellis sp. KUC8613]|nr:galactose oxidase [Dentipellis sp. KUC8613]